MNGLYGKSRRFLSGTEFSDKSWEIWGGSQKPPLASCGIEVTVSVPRVTRWRSCFACMSRLPVAKSCEGT